jgi:hypothetical protein
MADGLCTSYPYGPRWPKEFTRIIGQYTETDLHITEGQPFALGTIYALAKAAGGS